MAIIPGDIRFIGIGPEADLVEKKSSLINSGQQPYTMQDFIDTAGGGGTPAGTDGQIQFNSSSAFGADSNLYWDNTNKRLGVGTNAPQYTLDVAKSSGSLDAVFSNSDATATTTIYEDNNIGRGIRISTYGDSASGTLLGGAVNRARSVVIRTNDGDYPIVFGGFNNSSIKYFFGSNGFTLALDTSTNNVTIGASGGTARLQVKGSGSTSATTPLLVQNSSGTGLFTLKDNGEFVLGGASDFGCVPVSGCQFRFSLAVGTLSLASASAILQADSTTRGFLPPRMTTAQKLAIASPAAGLQVYDSTLNQMSYYNGSTWVNF